MICVSCGTKDGKFYQVENDEDIFDACTLCLVKGMNILRKKRNRSKEEGELLHILVKIVGGQVIRA